MRVKELLLDWWGRSDRRCRLNVVEAALRKAGDRGRTGGELTEATEFSLDQVRAALRKLREKGRAAADGDRWRASGT